MHSAQPVLEQFLLTKVLPHIGEMGVYQITLFMLLCIPATLPAAFLAFNQVESVVKIKVRYNVQVRVCVCRLNSDTCVVVTFLEFPVGTSWRYRVPE